MGAGLCRYEPKGYSRALRRRQGSMYHHFKGKADLAAAAINLSAAAFKESAEKTLSAPGTAMERIRGYLLRSREVLKGCQIGKLTQDPEITADKRLRAPIDETFMWLQSRLQGLIEEAQETGENSCGSECIRYGRDVDCDDTRRLCSRKCCGGSRTVSSSHTRSVGSTTMNESYVGAIHSPEFRGTSNVV